VHVRGGRKRRAHLRPVRGAREAARDYVAGNVGRFNQLLDLDPPRSGEVEIAEDLEAAVPRAWMVIEAVPEEVELKRKVFAQLDELADGDAILASNSSSIPTSQMIDDVEHPERVLNTH
jgi:3-hydroxybutyryl-CoA dehydrogenase